MATVMSAWGTQSATLTAPDLVYGASPWGTANVDLEAPPPPVYGASSWGTANATLTSPTPPTGPSSWGTATASLGATGSVVVWRSGAWHPVTPVYWVQDDVGWRP